MKAVLAYGKVADGPDAQRREACRKVGPIGTAMVKANPTPYTDANISGVYTGLASLLQQDAANDCRKHGYLTGITLQLIGRDLGDIAARLRELGVLH